MKEISLTMVNNIFRNIRVAFIIFCLSYSARTFSQQNSGCDLRFIGHLVNRGNFREALFLLDSTPCILIRGNDSADYFRGWSQYSLSMTQSSSESLIRVTPGSSFYLKSHFYAAYGFTLSGNFDLAVETLEKTELSGEGLTSLKNYQIAGTRLLQGNVTLFDEYIGKADRERVEIAEPSGKLVAISEEVRRHRSKSPFVAGLLSGIIPGSGKLYAGKRGEAFSTFLSTVGLGLVTWENYNKNGLNNFWTIAFGTVFAVSYVANIYGSVFTVRVMETEYKNNVKSSILFNLRIPLGANFDK
jgi:hypothetical protein